MAGSGNVLAILTGCVATRNGLTMSWRIEDVLELSRRLETPPKIPARVPLEIFVWDFAYCSSG
jgi:hypothetical protein